MKRKNKKTMEGKNPAAEEGLENEEKLISDYIRSNKDDKEAMWFKYPRLRQLFDRIESDFRSCRAGFFIQIDYDDPPNKNHQKVVQFA